MKNHWVRLLGLITLCLLAPAARADLITYQFSGTIGIVADYATVLPSNFGPGLSFTGTFQYDTSAPDQNSGGSDGIFRPGLNLKAQVTVTTTSGPLVFSMTSPYPNTFPPDEIDVIGNDFEYFKRNPSAATSYNPDVLTTTISFDIAPAGSFNPHDLGSIDLSHFLSASVGVSLTDAQVQGSYSFFNGTITSLAAVATPVPEPGNLLLCVTGVAALGGYRWRRSRAALRQPALP